MTLVVRARTGLDNLTSLKRWQRACDEIIGGYHQVLDVEVVPLDVVRRDDPR